MDAEEFIQSKNIIESTDIRFRTKVRTKNSLFTHEVEFKTLLELLDEFASLKDEEIEELKKEVDKVKLDLSNEMINSESLQRYWKYSKDEIKTHKNNLIKVCNKYNSATDKNMNFQELEEYIINIGNELNNALLAYKN